MALLGEMDDLLQLRVTATRTYGVLAHFGARLFGEDSGALRLLRKETKLLETVVIWGVDPPRFIISLRRLPGDASCMPGGYS